MDIFRDPETMEPAELRAYVEFIEQQTGVPVRIISVGPDRGQTVVR